MSVVLNIVWALRLLLLLIWALRLQELLLAPIEVSVI